MQHYGITHDGKVSIGTTEVTDYALNVQGTVSQTSKYIGGEFELTAGGTLSLGSSSTSLIWIGIAKQPIT